MPALRCTDGIFTSRGRMSRRRSAPRPLWSRTRSVARSPSEVMLTGAFGSVAKCLVSCEILAEGARFELAVHEVDAGFQDRWFQPLTHPSYNDFSYLRRATLFCLPICLPICEVPKALATSAA